MDRIKDLYDQLRLAESEVNTAAEVLHAKRIRRDRIEADLADTMAATGLLEAKMADGKQVKVKTEYFARANQGDMDRIREYLARTGNEALIPIKLESVKLTEDQYEELPDHLKGQAKYVANTNQVKAFVRRLAEEDNLDGEVIDLFNVTTKNKLSIK